jgi:hypothetical protein
MRDAILLYTVFNFIQNPDEYFNKNYPIKILIVELNSLKSRKSMKTNTDELRNHNLLVLFQG